MLDNDEVRAAFAEFDVELPPIGSGHDKVVYQANDGNTNFALKVMSWAIPDDEEAGDTSVTATAMERFNREMLAMRTVSCPHVATVTHGPDIKLVGKTRHLWFGEPLLKGTLASVRGTGRLTQTAVVDLAKSLLMAVEAMWDAGRLVHRDIKPRNIGYLDGRVVLIDFGAVLFTELSPLTSPSMAGPGTAHYASPEQFAPRRTTALDFRSDLFQIGIVLHEAITGSHPFRGQGNDYYAALTSYDPAQLDGFECSDSLRTLVGRLLRERPAERFRTPGLALRMLEKGY